MKKTRTDNGFMTWGEIEKKHDGYWVLVVDIPDGKFAVDTGGRVAYRHKEQIKVWKYVLENRSKLPRHIGVHRVGKRNKKRCIAF